jgi:lactate dehydrogenase-like 2-hydroxyacid dehydrogenase
MVGQRLAFDDAIAASTTFWISQASRKSSAPKRKIVSRHGVGYDAADVAVLKARHVPAVSVGDVNSRAVAEHTLASVVNADKL